MRQIFKCSEKIFVYSCADADEGFDDDLDEDAGPSAEDLAAIESDSFDD